MLWKEAVSLKLFIIGNGFDIGHGLPTQYWDFRTYLENLHPDFLQAFEEHYYIYPCMSNEDKKKLLWNELETNLANIDEDIIIDQGVSIEMDLDGGDIGIEDTLYRYFSEEYNYIALLAKYLKQWVRTIRIRDVEKKSSLITNDNIYITFNYTAVLENIYNIFPSNITHIHGSLRQYDNDPVLGHGNQKRIDSINEKIDEAERLFDEKWLSICKVVKDYYRRTFKDVSRYAINLLKLESKPIDEIYVVGHSLAGVDRYYFSSIDRLTNNNLTWKVFYYHDGEMDRLKKNLCEAGIDENRIQMVPSKEFYDL